MKLFQLVKSALLISLLALAACSPKVDTRGHVTPEDWQKQVVAGKTTKDEVRELLGSPSAQSSFGPDTWYYMTSRKEAYAFMKPKVVDQDILRVEFDPNGVVIAAYVEENTGADFAIVKRTTPTEGHSLGFIEQIIGNIGRFNKNPNEAGSGSSSRH